MIIIITVIMESEKIKKTDNNITNESDDIVSDKNDN